MPESNAPAGYLLISRKRIEILTKWMSKGRDVNDIHLHKLLEMDDLYDQVYQYYRTRGSFKEADRKATKKVIESLCVDLLQK